MSSRELPRYNALDGLRGVAVLMVVLFHFWQWLAKYDDPHSAPLMRILAFMSIGQKGVDLFFVLSGFLITGILLRTRSSGGYFRTFYIRRSLRIFPLYFLVVIACLLAGAVWNLPQYSWHNTWWYLLYLQNIAATFWPHRIDGPVHFWSLAVEEHFYLFWPLAVFSLSRRALMALCISLILLAVAVRAWFQSIGLDGFPFTLCRFDTLAMGSLIACSFQNARQREFLARWSRLSFLPISVLSFGSFFMLSGSALPQLPTFKYSLFSVLCSLILVLVLSPGRFNIAPRLFDVSALRSLGKISYAIYVFHPFVLMWVNTRLYATARSPLYRKFNLAVLAELAMYLILTLAVARLSWVLLEHPILRLKDRFSYGAVRVPSSSPQSAESLP